MNEKTLPATRFDGFTNAGKLRQASHAVPPVRFTADDGSDYPEWEQKKVGNLLSDLYVGKSFSPEIARTGEFIVMDMGSVSSDGTIINTKRTNLGRDFLREGDLIMPKDDIGGGNIIGKTAYINQTGLYVCGDHVFRLRFTQESPLFMHFAINSPRVNRQIHKVVTGSAQLGLNEKSLRSIDISVSANFREQQQISSTLSLVDSTLDLCQRKLDLLTQAKKALMQQIFSQKVRFTADDGSDFPEWEEKKLGRLCESIASGKTKKSAEGQIPLWGSSGLLGHTKEAEFKGDYLIIGRVGVAAGCVRHYVGDFSASDNTLVIKPMIQEISSVWLTGYLEYFNLNRLTFGSSQPLITATQLKRLSVITPKLQEQQKIASCLSSADALIAQARAELEQWQEVKKSLLQQLFV